jgi:hypothetical protein
MLYFAGVGSLDAATDMLTRFVSTLRDLGLTVEKVQVLEGQYHGDLVGVPSNSEDGWTMHAYGSGDLAAVYGEIPGFLKQFEESGIRIVTSGIGEGALREIPIGATA